MMYPVWPNGYQNVVHDASVGILKINTVTVCNFEIKPDNLQLNYWKLCMNGKYA